MILIEDILPKWILTKVELPPDRETCIVTLRQKYDHEKEWHYYTDVADYVSGEWITFNDWDEGQGFEVIAWMPLPQPYKRK